MSKRCGDKPAKKARRFSCSKCGATANSKNELCKPVR